MYSSSVALKTYIHIYTKNPLSTVHNGTLELQLTQIRQKINYMYHFFAERWSCKCYNTYDSQIWLITWAQLCDLVSVKQAFENGSFERNNIVDSNSKSLTFIIPNTF